MIKLFKSLVCIVFLWHFNLYAGDLYTEKDKLQVYSGAYHGCINKQMTGESTGILKAEVIPKFCQCFANMVVADLFGNIDFQIAVAKKNTEMMQSITATESSRDNTMIRFNACTDKVS